jgi:hypothetical protein
MAFQFLCPQGHLLQGEESQAGEQCQCPQCGTLFLIPSPSPPAAPASTAPAEPSSPPPAPAEQFAPPSPSSPEPTVETPPESAASGFPGIQTEASSSVPGSTVGVPEVAASKDRRPELVHIACPSGHELETPRDMLGQMAMCPYCQAQFQLRWEDSVEYRRRKVEALERKQAKAARMWLQWAIGAAVVVVLGLIVMIALSRGH